MTDLGFIEKKLAFIETCVRELQQLCQPERIPDDITVVYGYQCFKPLILQDIVRYRVGDLLAFVSAIRSQAAVLGTGFRPSVAE